MPLTLTNPIFLRLIGLFMATGAGAYALDNDVRLVPQLAYGTAGFEPGLALEWHQPDAHGLIVRPELLLIEDDKLGGGGAILFDLSSSLELPSRHAVAIGPRVVYHHANHYGWEADGMLTWSVDLEAAAQPWRHSVGLLGALGLVEDNRRNDTDVGATVGIFYAFRF